MTDGDVVSVHLPDGTTVTAGSASAAVDVIVEYQTAMRCGASEDDPDVRRETWRSQYRDVGGGDGGQPESGWGRAVDAGE